jgi:outer membrane murein-binding lipoprotein Lpp
MNSLSEQLVHAYRRQKDLYLQVLELAREQCRVMTDDQAVSVVMQLSARVEELLDEIATIEEAIEPAKDLWQRERQDPQGELDALLHEIQAAIEQTSSHQEELRLALIAYMRQREQKAQETRADIQASKARLAYRAG